MIGNAATVTEQVCFLGDRLNPFFGQLLCLGAGFQDRFQINPAKRRHGGVESDPMWP